MSFVFTFEILSRLFLIKLFASILPVVPSRLITFLRLSRALCCNCCPLLTFRDMCRFKKARKSAFEFKGAVDVLRNLDPVQPFVLSISIKGRSLSLSFSTSDVNRSKDLNLELSACIVLPCKLPILSERNSIMAERAAIFMPPLLASSTSVEWSAKPLLDSSFAFPTFNSWTIALSLRANDVCWLTLR